MILTNDQIKIFELNAISKFKKECIHYLRDNFPQKFEGENDDTLIRKIDEAIELALQFGFKHGASIQKILAFMIMYNLQYETEFSSTGRKIIESKGTPEDMRIFYMEEVLVANSQIKNT